MKQHSIKLPAQLYESLNREAKRLELDLDFLVAGLVKSFLDKQEQNLSRAFDGQTSPYDRAEHLADIDTHDDMDDLADIAAPGDMDDFADQDRRGHARTRVDISAMLYFKTDNGRSIVYKAGGLRDIGPGGVMLECEQPAFNEQELLPGRQFELIFQLNEDEVPVRVQCEICRVDQLKDKTRLGVAFKGIDERGIDERLSFAFLREPADK